MSDWEKLLEVEHLIQTHFPDAVLVGGTAAAIHAEHRLSHSVLADLRRRFPEVLAELEHLAGWKTRRIRPPVLILGRFEGVDVGIRQLVRAAPLEATRVAGVTVPTLAEMLRIKGWLVVTRNAVRHFIDFCSLADRAGDTFADAMREMDTFYPQPEDSDTTGQQLAKMLAEPRPHDFDPTEDSLRVWRELRPPWTDWAFILGYCRKLSARLFNVLMEGGGWRGTSMKHRHLVPDFLPNTALVEDILERGTIRDWQQLAEQIRQDPRGPYARAVERVISGSHFYGTTNLWKDFLDRCRSQMEGPPG